MKTSLSDLKILLNDINDEIKYRNWMIEGYRNDTESNIETIEHNIRVQTSEKDKLIKKEIKIGRDYNTRKKELMIKYEP